MAIPFKRFYLQHPFVAYILAPCCTLHNSVESYKEEFVDYNSNEVEIVMKELSNRVNRFVDNYERNVLRFVL